MFPLELTLQRNVAKKQSDSSQSESQQASGEAPRGKSPRRNTGNKNQAPKAQRRAAKKDFEENEEEAAENHEGEGPFEGEDQGDNGRASDEASDESDEQETRKDLNTENAPAQRQQHVQEQRPHERQQPHAHVAPAQRKSGRRVFLFSVIVALVALSAFVPSGNDRSTVFSVLCENRFASAVCASTEHSEIIRYANNLVQTGKSAMVFNVLFDLERSEQERKRQFDTFLRNFTSNHEILDFSFSNKDCFTAKSQLIDLVKSSNANCPVGVCLLKLETDDLEKTSLCLAEFYSIAHVDVKFIAFLPIFECNSNECAKAKLHDRAKLRFQFVNAYN